MRDDEIIARNLDNNCIRLKNTTVQNSDNRFTFGYVDNAKFIYDCRIRDFQNNKQCTVIIYASDYGEAKWCLIGFLKHTLVVVDTNDPAEKYFVMPNDMEGRRLKIKATRIHNI